MSQTNTLLEVARMLRQAASMLEREAVGGGLAQKQPRVPGIRNQIKSFLEGGGTYTSGQIADALYGSDTGVDPGTFRRRVIVTLSSMHKKDHTVELVTTSGGPAWRKSSAENTKATLSDGPDQ